MSALEFLPKWGLLELGDRQVIGFNMFQHKVRIMHDDWMIWDPPILESPKYPLVISYWKWQFIVCCPLKSGDVPNVMSTFTGGSDVIGQLETRRMTCPEKSGRGCNDTTRAHFWETA